MSKYAVKKEYKLSEESAKEQIQIAIDYFDIDLSGKNEEANQAIEDQLDLIVDDIRQGLIEIKNDSKFEVVQHQIGGGSDIVYSKFGGAIKVAMSSKKVDDHYGRMYALLGASSGLGEDAIKQLGPKNIKVAERLSVLFL